MNGVIRFEKYHRNSVFGIQREQNRKVGEGSKFSRSSVDDERTKDNKFFKSSNDWNKRINEIVQKYGVKVRKDSVVLVGAIITASSDYFTKNPKYKEPSTNGKDERTEEEKRKWIYDEKTADFCKDSIRTFVKKMCQGETDRIVSCKLDMDEDTPHLHIYFVPIHKEKDRCSLSAKKLMNGRVEMRNIQNLFYDEVFKKRGFDRGEMVDWDDPTSKKYHTTTINYKKQQNRELEQQNKTLEKENDKLRQKLVEYSKRLEKVENEVVEMEKLVGQVYDVKELEEFVDKCSINHATKGKTSVKSIFEEYQRFLQQKHDKASRRTLSNDLRQLREDIKKDVEEYELER